LIKVLKTNTLKYFLSGILIFSVLLFQFSETLIFIAFKINQEYIAANLCVEKDVENSTCKGCCQLKKKLANQKEQKEQLPPSQDSKYNIDFFARDINKITMFFSFLGITKSELTLPFCKFFLFRVFHPPRKIS
jgi:hypothetical protein